MNVHPKTSVGAVAGGIGGSLGVILMWILSLRGIVTPPDVAAAISTVLGVLVGFVGSYFAPNYSGDPPAKEGTP